MSSVGADDALNALREAAESARANAYCPYSHFPVGAALEAEDGRVFVGCNVENAAFPAGICAERSALAAAVAAGARKFRSVVIVSSASQSTPPCGICRQALVEFAPALDVVSFSASGKAERWSMTNLLPAPFMPASLENA